MSDALFISRNWRAASATRFWVLLGLSAVIASAGVVGDSTATVIGAMIVAPLMVPILGTALAVVLGDNRRLAGCVALVVGGAAVVVAVGWLVGSIDVFGDAYAGNSQIEGRISPRLIDLLAAVATGTVGAFALVRSDVSDTLPGVAIAISLVPPLAVVGILLSAGRGGDAAGALLLFGTNVAAIIATGTIVLLLYRVRDAARGAGIPVGRFRGIRVAVILGLVLVIAAPLSVGSLRVALDHYLARTARPIVEGWAARNAWAVTDVTVANGALRLTVLGAPEGASADELRRLLDAGGLDGADVVVRLVPGTELVCRPGEACRRPSIPEQRELLGLLDP